MNKRKFIRTLGAVAVGCMLAGGLCWKRENKLVVNPDWVNAEYEVRLKLYNPEAQRAILRDFTMAITDYPDYLNE